MKYRIEKDTIGEVKVQANKYWGAQTERSKQNFKIGNPASMPLSIIYAFAYIKKATAKINYQLKQISEIKKTLIIKVCDEIIEGKHDDQFPLVIWQTGSGTQTNMNINEVIANRGHVLNGGKLEDSNKILHPNDDVNKSQSSNDTFPTAMHIASYKIISEKTLPSLINLKNILLTKSKEFMQIVKIGRTHLMDATPLTLGQEFSGYVSQIDHGINALKNSLPHLSELAIGGTAVGTGINSPSNFSKLVSQELSKITKLPLISSKNKFEAIASHDAIVESHAAIKQVATSLNKIANDIRMLASGPRSGIGELILPENEPGSSIMPGKVNPTQCEAITMVCSQIIGNDVTITFAGAQGHYELNVFKPVMAANIIESATLIADATNSFTENCVRGIKPNYKILNKNLENSLMLVTALNTKIGYEKAAEIANLAFKESLNLKEATLKLGYLNEDEFDEAMNINSMI